MRRVFSAAPCAPGTSIVLDPEESHHVSRVLRLRTGDEVAVFDGSGGEWDATIEAIEKSVVRLQVRDPRTGDSEPPIAIVVHQAIVRPERVEWVLQKGTEVGVSAFRLFAAERSEADVPSPARLERYERIVMEAAKQSGRRRVPTVSIGAIEAASPERRCFVLDTSSGGVAFATALARGATREVGIAVGPEGGFSEAELERSAAQGWDAVSLGPRILRTETAGVVAAAIVLHAWGDLGR
ncbi:MAG TPA: 16S rRNA (uracil(1498)-N(3))-methyltransferase [Candidatus Polarisedimenticolaceae bacterium]|nr:16S rRNA (uracil(1498)-N(3))-methyltransferase [Candidatus Polarisedimenticolaceae bacterium]